MTIIIDKDILVAVLAIVGIGWCMLGVLCILICLGEMLLELCLFCFKHVRWFFFEVVWRQIVRLPLVNIWKK